MDQKFTFAKIDNLLYFNYGNFMKRKQQPQQQQQPNEKSIMFYYPHSEYKVVLNVWISCIELVEK